MDVTKLLLNLVIVLLFVSGLGVLSFIITENTGRDNPIATFIGELNDAANEDEDTELLFATSPLEDSSNVPRIAGEGDFQRSELVNTLLADKSISEFVNLLDYSGLLSEINDPNNLPRTIFIPMNGVFDNDIPLLTPSEAYTYGNIHISDVEADLSQSFSQVESKSGIFISILNNGEVQEDVTVGIYEGIFVSQAKQPLRIGNTTLIFLDEQLVTADLAINRTFDPIYE